MDRRAFLKIPTGVLMATAAASLSAPDQALASSSANEAVVKGPSAAAAARQALRRLGGMERFVQPGRNVAIKSSASLAQFQSGIAPGNLELIREILLMCQEAGSACVLVLDSSLYNIKSFPPHYNNMALCDGTHKHDACQDWHGYDEITILENRKMPRQARAREAENILTALPASKGYGAPQVALDPMYQKGINYELSIGYREQNQCTTAVDLYSFNSASKALIVINIAQTLHIKGADGEELMLHPTYYCPGI
ncbi:MAG: hypothetical protein LBJ14_08965 [Desulfarculales bacterium]|jgi:hypothetical protein|nr:hypothetical protein [Desulfarculales bacterium]